ncbi:MAG: Gfo/Idh/MocA family oxidoreductase [Intrasporangium sp.]|uniref:Gfo/Idh/MocA family protein n=1 Tax=Intrasporangium sp. TaxID=1925024 RepID=UPI00264A2DA9|nr:Gfo/Idh/MocA family oxidoreductase [Intrasporangium sp.]MDN5794808.1 Gfo/Idh/MocA family oxidoreductase [Intrasporangium sp.]
MTQHVRLGVVGFGWMGQAHARALTRVRHHYPDLPVVPELAMVADNAPDSRLELAKDSYGFAATTADWRELVTSDAVDVVSVTGPNFIHAEVAVAAAQAGKHLWVEKPAGRGLAETRAIAEAAARAGVHSAVGFNYRNAPAVEHARELVRAGRIGEVTHARFQMLGDYAAHPQGAHTWRFTRALSGSGVIGDLGSHGADLAEYLVGPIVRVMAQDCTFITQRPASVGAASHFSRGAGGPLETVENEDYVSMLVAFESGARGVLEASRASVGEQNAYGFVIHGRTGAIAWDFRRMGELRVCLDQDYQAAMWSTRLVGPGLAEFGVFQPDAGIAMSYDDLKVIEAKRLLESIVSGVPTGATLADAVRAATVAEAAMESITSEGWVKL